MHFSIYGLLKIFCVVLMRHFTFSPLFLLPSVVNKQIFFLLQCSIYPVFFCFLHLWLAFLVCGHVHSIFCQTPAVNCVAS